LPETPAAIAAEAAKRAAVFGIAPMVLLLKSLMLAPLLEEGFYRGLIMPLLKKYLPLWMAVGVPTGFFALTHISAGYANVVFAGAAGLLFSWIVLRSRSLWPAMLCHAAVNLGVVWVFGPFLRVRGLADRAGLLHPVSLLLLAGSIALLVAGLRVLRGEFSRSAAARAFGPGLIAAEPLPAK
jgi:hypothetical protein